MSDARKRVQVCLTAMAGTAAVAGILILVLKPVWISYGVLTRYLLGSPDRYVTEATALLLIPLAFLGLPLAFRSNAIPEVTVLVNLLPPRLGRYLFVMKLMVMSAIGGFFTYMTCAALIRSYQAGTASSIIGWPEWPIWLVLTACMGLFTLQALHRLVLFSRDRE
jgi:TRAP-type C4-dicarboxylate transport system permease small subunit